MGTSAERKSLSSMQRVKSDQDEGKALGHKRRAETTCGENCPGEDLNLYDISATSPLNWRVYHSTTWAQSLVLIVMRIESTRINSIRTEFLLRNVGPVNRSRHLSINFLLGFLLSSWSCWGCLLRHATHDRTGYRIDLNGPLPPIVKSELN